MLNYSVQYAVKLCLEIDKKMSMLNYFRKIDTVPSDKNEGLNELLGPTVLKKVNSEMRKIDLTPESSSNIFMYRKLVSR